MSGASLRGQTHIDFVVGISLFLLTSAFVAGFVPEMLDSYEGQATPAVADRVADELVEDLLAAHGAIARPGVLNESCTVAFFAQNGDCGFESGESLTSQLGIGSVYEVNVTLAWNVSGSQSLETLCHDGSDVVTCASGTERLAVGPAVPDNYRSVAAARRTVTVDDRLAILEIRVW